MPQSRLIAAILLSTTLAGCAPDLSASNCSCGPRMQLELNPALVAEQELAIIAGDRVFFGFDSSVLPRDECGEVKGPAALTMFRPVDLDCRSPISANSIIGRQAASLAKHPFLNVVIAGNTDERGTETYNLALGQRRADAVRDDLLAQGVAPSRITTISYGKDRPIAPGHNESAWQQNRNAITSVQGFNPQAQ